jgi:glycerophosphoryl diester phosphodiesterase
MKFGTHPPGPHTVHYNAVKETIKDHPTLVRCVLLSEVRLRFRGDPIDYLALLKLVKKHHKHNGENLWEPVVEAMHDVPEFQDRAIFLGGCYDALYPQYSLSMFHKPTQLIAHRGLDAPLPAGTRLRASVAFLELDVCLTDDEQVVVHHDILTKDGRMIQRSHSKSLLCHTLDSILESYQLPVPILLDVKGAGTDCTIIDRLVHLLKKHKATHFPIITFNMQYLHYLHLAHGDCILNYGPITASFDPDHMIRTVRTTNSNLLVLDSNHCSEEYVSALRAGAPHINILCYTVNQFNAFKHVADCGVDYIISDLGDNLLTTTC